MKAKNPSRRDFMKISLLATAGLSVSAPMVFSSTSFAADPALVDEKSPIATALHYTIDKSKVKDKSLAIVRQGVAFKSQNCSGCGLYQGKAGDKSGTCPLFQGSLVSANGWCQSWNKKA